MATKRIEKKITFEVKDALKGIKALKGSISLAVGSLAMLKKGMEEATKYTDNYVSSVRILDSVFGKSNTNIRRYIDSMQEMTGLDETSLTRKVAMFGQMSTSLGVAGKNAELLSEGLTTLTTKLSLLYNYDFNEMAQMLQNVMQGKSTTFGSNIGVVINQNTMQNTLSSLGIDRKVSSLSTAEQAILRYLTVQKQLSNEEINYSNIVNQVAWQKQMLTAQVVRLKTALGNMLYPILERILPVLNAILIVLTNIINAIAKLLGFKMDKLSSNIENGAISWDNYGTAVKNASKQLRGFDKLNNITTPTTSSTGFGGINNKLLEELKKYDEGMFNVNNKASEWAEKIMKVLGFHKEINEITGETEWIYDGIGASIKGIWEWFKKLSPLSKTVVASISLLAGAKVLTGIGKLVTLFGNKTGLTKWVNKLVTPLDLLYLDLKNMGKLSFSNLSGAVNDWHSSLTTMQKISTSLIGFGGMVTSINILKGGIKSVTEEGTNMSNVLQSSFGAIGTVLSGGLAGAALGGASGGIIGMVIGLGSVIYNTVKTANSALDTNTEEIRKNKEEIEKLYKSWEEGHENLVTTITQSNSEAEYYHNLKTELENITDENGKIKDGYEARAKVIADQLSEALGIEISVTDGIIDNYKTIIGQLDELIEKKQAQLKLEAVEEQYKDAIKNRNDAEKQLSVAIDKRNDAEKTLRKTLDSNYAVSEDMKNAVIEVISGTLSAEQASDKYNVKLKDLNKTVKNVENRHKKQAQNLKDSGNSYKTATDLVDKYSDSVKDFGITSELVMNGSYKTANEYVDNIAGLYNKDLDNQNVFWQKTYNEADKQLAELDKNRSKYNEKEYNNLVAKYTNEKALASREMENIRLILKTKNGEIDNDTVSAWINMGNNSVNGFMTELGKLDRNIQEELIKKMYARGSEMNANLQAGLNSRKISISAYIEVEPTAESKKILNDIVNSGKLQYHTRSSSVGFKASGGFLDKGELFWARENGIPEMVGSLGGKGAVANNYQIEKGIAEASYQGMMRAFNSMGGFKNNTVIEASADDNGLMQFITFKQKERERQYDL